MKGNEEIRGERSRYVGSWTSIGYCQELTEQSINGGYGMANQKARQEMEDKKWRTRNGGQEMEDKKWRTRNGGQEMEDKKWRIRNGG
jgi:hypothetical protein